MDRVCNAVDRIIAKVSMGLALLAAASALLLTFVVAFGVMMRFVFNSSQNWTDELASYCLLWMVFFGLTYTLNAGAHIRIDFLTDSLPPGARRVAAVAVWAFGTLFAALLFLGGLTEVENFVRRETYSTEGLDIPLVWPAMPMLLGSALFLLAFLARLVRLVLGGRAPTLCADDATR